MNEGEVPPFSYQQAWLFCANHLAQAGVEAPKREARLLLCAALSITPADFILRANKPLGEEYALITPLLKRRIAREPLSRILRKREFFSLDFKLNDATLDPRPDSEILVEAVLEFCKKQSLLDTEEQAIREGENQKKNVKPLRILDLGTGSGALLLSLLHNLPQAYGVGIDVSSQALTAANQNACDLSLQARVRFLTGDLFSPLRPKDEEGEREPLFDVILSNPPYIRRGELADLAPEVRLYDPVLALDGGEDGLFFYSKILVQARDFLKKDGLLALEIGADQADSVSCLMRATGWGAPTLIQDLAGHDRVLAVTL